MVAMEEEVVALEEEAEAMEVQAIAEVGAMEILATIRRRLWTKLKVYGVDALTILFD